jgi:hypothetical protein
MAFFGSYYQICVRRTEEIARVFIPTVLEGDTSYCLAATITYLSATKKTLSRVYGTVSVLYVVSRLKTEIKPSSTQPTRHFRFGGKRLRSCLFLNLA